jgi:hypothetical protein
MSVPLSIALRRHFFKIHFKHKIIGKDVNGFLRNPLLPLHLAITAHWSLNLKACKKPGISALYTQKSMGFSISHDPKF